MSFASYRRKVFIKELLMSPDINPETAAKAAAKAGFSEKNAGAAARRLMNDPEVGKLIQKEMDRRSHRTGITKDSVLKGIACLAYFDPADYVGIQSPEDIKKLTKEQRSAIAGWKWDKGGRFTLVFVSKHTAFDQLGRHLKLFTDKVEVAGVEDLAERLKEARERTAGRH